MNREVWPPGPPLCTTSSPGTARRMSGRSCNCRASISAAVMTLLLVAISSRGVGTRVALTMTDSSSKSWACAIEDSTANATEEHKIDFNTAFSCFQETARTFRLTDFHSGAPRRLQHCRRCGSPRCPRRTPAGHKTTVRGRFPGFRFTALVRLPRPCGLSGSWTIARRLQLRGQPRRHTAFPRPCTWRELEARRGLGQVSIAVSAAAGAPAIQKGHIDTPVLVTLAEMNGVGLVEQVESKITARLAR